MLLITHNITEAVQLVRPRAGDDLPARQGEAHGRIELPRPRTSEIVSSEAFGRYVAQIWGDLREEASRGMRDDETRMRAERKRDARGAHDARCRAARCSVSARCVGVDRCWSKC